jgi:hypothetical protein
MFHNPFPMRAIDRSPNIRVELLTAAAAAAAIAIAITLLLLLLLLRHR